MQVEIRADRKSMVARGHVNVVGRDSRVLHSKQGPYIEQIMPGAFAKALSVGAPVELRWDHKKTLGSTANQDELELQEDNVGLRTHAIVTDEEVVAAVDRKELRGWSFGFVKQKDHRKVDEEDTRRRFVGELELREVSILDKTPAYTATSIETREDGDTLVEFRMDEPLEDSVDCIHQTKRIAETKEITMSPSDESAIFCVQKTIEVYKMKRRLRYETF